MRKLALIFICAIMLLSLISSAGWAGTISAKNDKVLREPPCALGARWFT